MAAVVAGALTSPRYALPAALAVSVAVHAAALGWWAPAVWWTPAPSAPSQPELRATLMEEQVVTPSPATAERAPPDTHRSVAAATPARAQRPAATVPVVAAPVPPPVMPAAPAAPPVPSLVAALPPPAAAPASGDIAPRGATGADGGGAAGSAAASETTPIAYRDNPSPPYPDAARRDGQQGLTVLEVLVSRDGLPIDVAIVATSGFSDLDAAAAAGLRHWRFVPAMRDHEPIDARIRIPVRFRLTADGR